MIFLTVLNEGRLNSFWITSYSIQVEIEMLPGASNFLNIILNTRLTI